jgi:tetratricopeptide (TPR) repeat protein
MPKLRWILWIVAVVAVGAAVMGFNYWRDPQRRYQRGVAALRAGDEPALQAAVASLDGYPRYAAHRAYLQGALYLRQGDVEKALQSFEGCHDHPDLECQTLVLTGQALYQTGHPGHAKLAWERALTLDPNTVDAHRWLGVMYYDLGTMGHAIRHLQAASKLDPNDPRPDRLMGLINSDYERPNFAIDHYRESLRRDPNQHDVDQIRLELAKCEVKQREFEAALKTLEPCPSSARQKAILAECHWNLGQHDLARRLIDEALAAAPDDVDAQLQKAQILLADSQVQQATNILRMAVEKHPYHYNARYQLGQILRRSGADAEAAQHEQRAEELQQIWARFSDLQIDAINQPTNAGLRFEIGTLAQQLGKIDLARSWYQAALAIDPTFLPAADALTALGPAK